MSLPALSSTFVYAENISFSSGPVVQSIVSPTSSLRRQFVKYMLTILSNPLLFFVEKMILTL